MPVEVVGISMLSAVMCVYDLLKKVVEPCCDERNNFMNTIHIYVPKPKYFNWRKCYPCLRYRLSNVTLNVVPD